MNDLDDIIIPPPSEFADTPIINVINYYVIKKEGPPESNPIQYIIND